MGDRVSAALQAWESAVRELERLEGEWLALAPCAPGRDALRLRCDLLAIEADALFEHVLSTMRTQPAAGAACAA